MKFFSVQATTRSRRLLGSLCLLFLMQSGCSLLEAEGDNCDVSFSEKVRVIPCKGVDGVEFGDSIEEVRAKLGTTYSTLGWTDGLHRGWRSLHYFFGQYADLEINFLIKEDGATTGPIDTFILFANYSGQTQEGLGIGSTLDQVIQAYGTPAYIDDSASRDLYTYCFGERHLNLGIRGDTVFVMNMGYFMPMPSGPAQYCR